jgi:hypothetical protein
MFKYIGLLSISTIHAWLEHETVDINKIMEGVDPRTVKELKGSHPKVMSTA